MPVNFPVDAKPAVVEPILSLCDINKWFNRGQSKEVHILKGVTITLARAEVLVLLGPSGSGKSTLLRCMNLIAPPDSGTLHFAGKEWANDHASRFNLPAQFARERKITELRSQIGMVFQQINHAAQTASTRHDDLRRRQFRPIQLRQLRGSRTWRCPCPPLLRSSPPMRCRLLPPPDRNPSNAP